MKGIFYITGAILFGTLFTTGAVTLDVPETWSSTSSLSGWQSFTPASGSLGIEFLVVTNGMLTLQPIVDPVVPLDPSWSFVAGQEASGGAFTGSYYDYGVSLIKFDFQSSVSATLKVQLINNTVFGAVFNATIPIAPSSSPTNVSVRIDLDHFSPDLFGDDATFEAILRQTDNLWITLEWDKNEPQPQFSIDNVTLLGSDALYGTWIDGFGLDSALVGYNVDADGDGLLNSYEYVIDSYPNVSNGPFVITMETNTLRWIGSSNCIYSVLRSTNLVDGIFEPTTMLPGISGEMHFKDPASFSNAFYKIYVERR